MNKSIFAASLLFASATACAEAKLTALETKWLGAAMPVLQYAAQIKLPIDIIVQPQSGPADVPIAMGFEDGRCKLVLSMRGNPNAESILDKVAPAQQAILIEAMTAHEVAHCWRYAQGIWHALPSGFQEVGEEPAISGELLAQTKAMRENRREEGFSDLAALAWTKRNHPLQYGQVHAWLERVRADQPVAGNAHDTRIWVKLATDMSALGAGATPFDDVGALWSEGLLGVD